MLDANKHKKLNTGCVIPAHPLALDGKRRLDERHQKALTRYYLAAGAGGLAVGVHTTQFAIHDPNVGLYGPVLELAMDTAQRSCASARTGDPIMIAGIVGQTEQAVREARLAVELGYDIGLLSLSALKGKSIAELIDHSRSVAEVIPIMGFYLQSAISGMVLPGGFWHRFLEIPNVVAIKIAPFNRYQTLDVLQAVASCGRADEISLYTGNDDNIIVDLLTCHTFFQNQREIPVRIVGGLLGQWACWTQKAVELLETIKSIHASQGPVPQDMLTLAGQLTLANKAIFDPENDFAGCIPGIAYVLKGQGLVSGVETLDPHEHLSPGQAERIDDVIRYCRHLTDDDFVTANLETWLQD